ncbi:RES family NAD+ phosphorylase [Neorhizobium sp. NPDC001467]|uniref:RES family NAD+ phosphorylase n=1 Tax=Neorhizobium sp. NPDC001467 TaxID=3390595 RepID=UPI003D06AB4F
MILWRISNHADLSGRGGRLAPGRWHSQGMPIVYCSDHPSTTLLEMLVHADLENLPKNFQLLKIKCPDDLSIAFLEKVDPSDEVSTRESGDAWLSQCESCLLGVPSAVLPVANNILINPRHADAARLEIEAVMQYPFDSRLLR